MMMSCAREDTASRCIGGREVLSPFSGFGTVAVLQRMEIGVTMHGGLFL